MPWPVKGPLDRPEESGVVCGGVAVEVVVGCCCGVGVGENVGVVTGAGAGVWWTMATGEVEGGAD